MGNNSFNKSEGMLGNLESLANLSKLMKQNGGVFENINKTTNFADKIPQAYITNPMQEYYKDLEKCSEAIRKEKQEQYEREVENNENLKNLVEYNNEIAQYNKELVKLNEKILTKVNSLDDTLFFLFQSFKDKYESDGKLGQEHNALLLELITIIDSKDKGKITEFFDKVPVPLGVGLLVEYFKMKLGLS